MQQSVRGQSAAMTLHSFQHLRIPVTSWMLESGKRSLIPWPPPKGLGKDDIFCITGPGLVDHQALQGQGVRPSPQIVNKVQSVGLVVREHEAKFKGDCKEVHSEYK